MLADCCSVCVQFNMVSLITDMIWTILHNLDRFLSISCRILQTPSRSAPLRSQSRSGAEERSGSGAGFPADAVRIDEAVTPLNGS
jgi:hypothetical protein